MTQIYLTTSGHERSSRCQQIRILNVVFSVETPVKEGPKHHRARCRFSAAGRRRGGGGRRRRRVGRGRRLPTGFAAERAARERRTVRFHFVDEIIVADRMKMFDGRIVHLQEKHRLIENHRKEIQFERRRMKMNQGAALIRVQEEFVRRSRRQMMVQQGAKFFDRSIRGKFERDARMIGQTFRGDRDDFAK